VTLCPGGSRPSRVLACLCLAAAVPACRAAPSVSSASRIQLDLFLPPDAIPARGAGCDAQAARFAENDVWRSSTGDRLVRHVAHYSGKYDECYVLLERTFFVPASSPPVVSELWEAFDGTSLAVFTDDGREAMRRSFCQVTLSDDPFTSCAVSKFFIDEHMGH